jgi:hypothetical protein
MTTGFLEGLVQLETPAGDFKMRLPILYHDCTSMTAIFTASTGKVKPYLPHASMRPVEFLPGRCLVAFTAFEYRKTDIDAYNEFSIACLITFDKTQIPGLTVARQMLSRCFSVYVWHLPVTTEIARAGGVEVYGYPKFIADIEFRRADGWVECSLSEGGTRILTLKGRDLPVKRGKIMKYVTYSIKDGIPLVTNVNIDPLEFAQTWSRGSAELSIGSGHAICEELNGIGLGKRPTLYQYSPVNQAILFAGRNLMDT